MACGDGESVRVWVQMSDMAWVQGWDTVWTDSIAAELVEGWAMLEDNTCTLVHLSWWEEVPRHPELGTWSIRSLSAHAWDDDGDKGGSEPAEGKEHDDKSNGEYERWWVKGYHQVC